MPLYLPCFFSTNLLQSLLNTLAKKKSTKHNKTCYYTTKKCNIKPIIFGGGQEKGLRGGTVPTHEVVGLGQAFEILKKEGKKDHERFKLLRARLIDGIKDLEGLKINQSENNLPNIISISFENIDGHMLLPTLSAIAASTGSACSSSNLKPSYILKAIGLSDEMARASIRLSFGRFTTKDQIDTVVNELNDKIPKLRESGSMWNVLLGAFQKV